ARAAPVAADRAYVEVERAGDLRLGQAAEVAQLDHPRQAFVQPGLGVQRLVEREQLIEPVPRLRLGDVLVQRGGPRAGPALLGQHAAGLVEQHEAHRARDQRGEVTTAADVQLRASQVSLTSEVGDSPELAWRRLCERAMRCRSSYSSS